MKRICITATSLCLMLCGCEAKPGPKTPSEAKAPPTAANNHKPVAEMPPDDEPAEEAPAEDDFASRVRRAMNDVARTSRNAANGASEMVTDLYDDATSAGSKATQETIDWLNSTYESAREAGETSTTNARDWVLEDLKRGGAWEYRIVELEGLDSEAVQKELNKLGAERWECYSVIADGEKRTCYLKRSSRSMLRSLPLRDVMRLLPLLGGGDAPTPE